MVMDEGCRGICHIVRNVWRQVKETFSIPQNDRIKLFSLCITYALIIGANTLAKDLKDAIFSNIVGKSYLPLAKVIAIVVLIPAILLYSKLVDILRRHKLLIFYASLYASIGLLFAALLGSPTIGLKNTDASPTRLFGWLFYFFIEGYSPFVVSVFWAFSNSITSPEGGRKNYALMTASSKIGGMLSAGLAWTLLRSNTHVTSTSIRTDVFNHQLLTVLFSVLLACIPIAVMMLMRKVAGYQLHGYEAAYKFEKEKKGKKTGIFTGLRLLFQNPYVMGIFGMIFFYELINVPLNLEKISVAMASAKTISGMSSYLFKVRFFMHMFGFLIALFGTSSLLRFLGERVCLMLIPSLIGIMLAVYMIFHSPTTMLIAFVGITSLNYGFSWPVREGLYIPTVKDIKFKSKSWIDAFGSKLAKTGGATAAKVLDSPICALAPVFAQTSYFGAIALLWLVMAYFLGKRYDQAISRNEVIGAKNVTP